MAETTETTYLHPTLAAALAAFQSELPSIRKGNTAKVKSERTNTEYSYSYADLTDVSEVALPLLGKHGLAWSAQPTLMDTMFVLHYSLTHESGESLEGIYPLPDATTPPQQLGSAITYARRYALTAITGVAPGGDDDDAQSAPAAPARQQRAAAKPKAQPAAKPTFQAATVDWAAKIIDAASVADLRDVFAEVEEKGEVGRPFDPQYRSHLDALVHLHGLESPTPDVKVGQMIGAVKVAMESKPAPMVETTEEPGEPMALGDPVEDWPTATPGGEQS